MKAIQSIQLTTICMFLSFICSCSEEDEPSDITYTYNFEEGMESWTAGFSDYPADWEESRMEFVFERRPLPDNLNESSQSVFVSGTNLSDDLFMFLKRQITGLEPDRTYRLTFEVELASQYPEDAPGIGGSPGASVYLKAGGSTEEPQATTKDGDIQMNIDKGNQSQGGDNMVVLGHIGIAGDGSSYELIQRENQNDPVNVRTDSLGNLWIIVGTDSGFEGTTALYYNRISVTLK